MIIFKPDPIEDDFSDLSIEDYKEFLSHQLKSYNSIQDQAHKIVRTWIAGLAIIIAFSGSKLVKLLEDYERPSGEITLAGGNLTLSKDVWGEIWSFQLAAAELSALIGVIFLIESLIAAVLILQTENIEPVSASVLPDDWYFVPVDKRREQRYKVWLEANRSTVHQANHLLSSCYNLGVLAILAFSMSIALVAGTYVKDLWYTGLANIFYNLLGGALFWGIVTYLSHGLYTGTINTKLNNIYKRITKGPSVVSLPVVFLLYFGSRTLVGPVLIIWITKFIPTEWENIFIIIYRIATLTI